jgi:Fic family protein
MREALDKFEKFLHDDSLPVLIQCGLAHAQFETIHPFLDGNGRVGRLLITLLLCQRKVLHRPLLYLSYYLKSNRAEYYDRLTAIRKDGNWESWLKFFLRGVEGVSGEAIEKARQIIQLRETHRDLISKKMSDVKRGFRLLDYLYDQPIVSVRMVENHLNTSYVTADKVVRQLTGLKILTPTSRRRRNRRYSYAPYIALFQSSANAESDENAPTTER